MSCRPDGLSHLGTAPTEISVHHLLQLDQLTVARRGKGM